MPKNLVFVTKTMSLACPEQKLQIWPSWEAWFFRNIFWPPQKNHEIGKKSKNGVHFISSVFKVVRVKVLSVLLFFAYFILFWGGSKCAHFFFQNVFSKRVKKGMKTAKTTKKNFFLLNMLTDWHTDTMFSDIILTFWTTFILITKLKSFILTYWHIDIQTCWHIDIRTYWHTEILFSDILLTFWTTFLLITKLRIDLKFWPSFCFWGGHQDL